MFILVALINWYSNVSALQLSSRINIIVLLTYCEFSSHFLTLLFSFDFLLIPFTISKVEETGISETSLMTIANHFCKPPEPWAFETHKGILKILANRAKMVRTVFISSYKYFLLHFSKLRLQGKYPFFTWILCKSLNVFVELI